jgi:hypothetical protein
MSSLVKGAARCSKFVVGKLKSSRLKLIVGLSVFPILSLKVFQREVAFPTWEEISLPSSFFKIEMVFLLNLSVAAACKNLVGSSPS